MSNGTLTERRVAKRKKSDKPKEQLSESTPEALTGGRIELQAPPEWIAKLDAAAARLGMSRSAYIRMACNRQMAADEKNA